MRSSIPFDTHAFVKRLTAAGVPERQAEVHAEALAEIAPAQLATKDDLSNMEERFKAEIAGVKAEIKAEIRELELRIAERLHQQMLWFFAAQVALFGALVALVKLF
ncbi:MAG: coiled-coil domain-containing protein [SAR324 cluster bacterium]